MPEVCFTGKNSRPDNTERPGYTEAASILHTTAGCSIYWEDTMYNENEDILILAGLDPEKMEYLTAAERKRLLEEAGLDPGEFDF